MDLPGFCRERLATVPGLSLEGDAAPETEHMVAQLTESSLGKPGVGQQNAE